MPKEATFSNCVAQHLPYLTRMVGGLTRNDTTTDDIVQQTMLKALLHADQFRFESTLKTWLTDHSPGVSHPCALCSLHIC
jgi:DNA-directed RNA polymerase specialized sigma24 family protein